MRIEWLGHAAFGITSQQGIRILTDPYEPGCYDGNVRYAPILETFDIVTVSHEHADHSGTKGLKGTPHILKGAASFSQSDVRIKSYPSFHDASNGRERGKNWIFVIEASDIRIAHMGDCGVLPDSETVGVLENLDILLVPVGGKFTLDAGQAVNLMRLLQPRLTIPMHFKTPKIGFDIDGIEPLCRLMPGAKKLKTTYLDYDAGTPLSGIAILEPSH
jgi:L-ascorbate metabolism protein UlaG (beta-lactamase superfamily)